MELLETETHGVAESCEIPIERMRYLTQILWMERDWESVFLCILTVIGSQPGGIKPLGFAVLYKSINIRKRLTFDLSKNSLIFLNSGSGIS